MSLYLCPRWRNKIDLFIYFIYKNNIVEHVKIIIFGFSVFLKPNFFRPMYDWVVLSWLNLTQNGSMTADHRRMEQEDTLLVMWSAVSRLGTADHRRMEQEDTLLVMWSAVSRLGTAGHRRMEQEDTLLVMWSAVSRLGRILKYYSNFSIAVSYFFNLGYFFIYIHFLKIYI